MGILRSSHSCEHMRSTSRTTLVVSTRRREFRDSSLMLWVKSYLGRSTAIWMMFAQPQDTDDFENAKESATPLAPRGIGQIQSGRCGTLGRKLDKVAFRGPRAKLLGTLAVHNQGLLLQ